MLILLFLLDSVISLNCTVDADCPSLCCTHINECYDSATERCCPTGSSLPFAICPLSSVCTDDWGCCNTACGNCTECSSGMCNSVAAGDDPSEFCDPGPCTTGDCDGSGGCGHFANGGESASCYGCARCQENGTCVPLSDMEGGNCVATGCISAFCNGHGVCAGHANGTDPNNACGNCTLGYCNGAGVCAIAPNGTDPLNNCPAHDCHEDYCDGSGRCKVKPNGAACSSQTCGLCVAGACVAQVCPVAPSPAPTLDEVGEEEEDDVVLGMPRIVASILGFALMVGCCVVVLIVVYLLVHQHRHRFNDAYYAGHDDKYFDEWAHEHHVELPPETVGRAEDIFRSFDPNHDGRLSEGELFNLMQLVHKDMTKAECKENAKVMCSPTLCPVELKPFVSSKGINFEGFLKSYQLDGEAQETIEHEWNGLKKLNKLSTSR